MVVAGNTFATLAGARPAAALVTAFGGDAEEGDAAAGDPAVTQCRDGEICISTRGSGGKYRFGCPQSQASRHSSSNSHRIDGYHTSCADCQCLSPSKPNMTKTVRNGEETWIYQFGGKKVSVTPAYTMHEYPEDFASEMAKKPGEVTMKIPRATLLERKEWLVSYKDNAPRLQKALASMRHEMKAELEEGPDESGEEQAEAMLDAELANRFGILQQQCATLKATASTLCTKGERCPTLDCYRAAADQEQVNEFLKRTNSLRERAIGRGETSLLQTSLSQDSSAFRRRDRWPAMSRRTGFAARDEVDTSASDEKGDDEKGEEEKGESGWRGTNKLDEIKDNLTGESDITVEERLKTGAGGAAVGGILSGTACVASGGLGEEGARSHRRCAAAAATGALSGLLFGAATGSPLVGGTAGGLVGIGADQRWYKHGKLIGGEEEDKDTSSSCEPLVWVAYGLSPASILRHISRTRAFEKRRCFL